jgi:hypothetical protein
MFRSSEDVKRRSKNRRAQAKKYGQKTLEGKRWEHNVLGLELNPNPPLHKGFISTRPNKIQPRGASRAPDPLTGVVHAAAQALG